MVLVAGGQLDSVGYCVASGLGVEPEDLRGGAPVWVVRGGSTFLLLSLALFALRLPHAGSGSEELERPALEVLAGPA